MPLKLHRGDHAPFFVVLLRGITPAGATFTAMSSDAINVTITADASPLPVSGGAGANATPPIPDGTPSLISGVADCPAGSTGTADVTLTITQSVKGQPDMTITDTVTPVDTETLGTLFGTEVSDAANAAAAHAKFK